MGIFEELQENFARYPLWEVPLYPEEVRGLQLLEKFWNGVERLEVKGEWPEERGPTLNGQLIVKGLVERPSPKTRFLLFAGKGGVGKTTLACATAIRLAQELEDGEVLLFSTDPAHSLTACLDRPIGPEPTWVGSGLTAMEIDAQAEFEGLKTEYAAGLEQFLGVALPNLDLSFDREVMERLMDLSPPGLDEVMALNRVMTLLAHDRYDLFILDAAPTGHLLRLLELPEIIDPWLKIFFGLFLKYGWVARMPKISQRLVQMSKDLKQLRTLLRDPVQSSLYAATVLTEMAFQETRDLMDACDRMGIRVPVLFLNLATPTSECSLCSALHQRESKVYGKYKETFPDRQQVLVYRQEKLQGLVELGRLGQVLYRPERIRERLGEAYVQAHA